MAGLVLALASTSCQSDKRNSILILAFDRLPSDAVSCNDDRNIESSGFAMLCKESIRFTHSYTTSLQPAAAMGSILSAQYPFQHQLHRSFDQISSQSPLTTALAAEKNLRSSFFSGSPHILKKTGLAKFFDSFDDSSAITQKNYFKDFKIQSADFFDWYNEDPGPFFSVIYNSELEFSKTEDGNSLEKLDEKLSAFFQQLKNEKLWQKTAIVLVGLNGVNKFQRINETPFQNLHSENTRVVTLIKLPRAKGDEGVYWKNDTSIQLADVGLMIKNLITEKIETPHTFDSAFEIINLQEIISNKNYLPSERQIIIEAPDTWSKELTAAQFAILHNNEVYIDGPEQGVFNTLTDLMETTNLYQQKKNSLEKTKDLISGLKKQMHFKEQAGLLSKQYINANTTDRLLSLNINFENIWGLANNQTTQTK